MLGSPVLHSLSPIIHSAALAEAGIAGTYDAREVDATGLAAAVAEMRAGSLDGANVTMPHKRLAHRLSDRCGEAARRAGAVNTLVAVAGEVVGHNTDVAGLRAAWSHNRLDPAGPVLVLGTGGAAASALVALEGRPITLSARRPEAATALIEATGVAASMMPFGSGLVGATVVNATPLGMEGEVLPAGVLESCVGLFEMAYAAGETPAEHVVAARGLPVSTGTEMLVAQAAESFRLWTGREASLDVMRQAVRGALRHG